MSDAILTRRGPSPDLDPDSKKERIQELEKAHVEDYSFTERDDSEDVISGTGFMGRFLKKNPSPVFLADVAKMNSIELDPAEVKRIERKLDLLIIPALATCYMVGFFFQTLP